ncbi:MAG: phosphoadenylyl-sulfate reductase [Balneolaceae bacterium]|nr:phosphoadenylyl-sulfate reductase [Balneolaceae bacterium]
MQEVVELTSLKEQFPDSRLEELNKRFQDATPDTILKWGYDTFGLEMVLGTGFGPSGIFLIDRLQQSGLSTPIFYLDTHLFFEETYELRDTLETRYNIDITRVSPDLSLDEQAEQFGSELWKRNPNRCCYLRKVRPLRNYLADKKAWITGVRRNQSETRKQTNIIEWDPENEVVKINPLANWTGEDVWDYINERGLPYNPLHDEGYPSIGCIPCTQPVNGEGEEQEHERSGRWTGSEKTECGIHLPTQNYKSRKTGT